MNINSHISGINRRQMPFESIVSKLIYVAFVNRFKLSELCALFAQRKSNRASYELYDGRFLFGGIKSVYQSMGFNESNEISIYSRFDEYKHTWFSKRLRICPICLELGYHSYWYQLNDFEVCPIHGCRIEEGCHSCGNTLPEYSINRKLFDDPYYCCICHKPISGVVPYLQLFNEFRAHADELQRLFSIYDCWAKYNIPYQGKGKFNFRAELGRYFNPVPNSVSVSASLIVVTWKIQMIMPPRYVPKYRLSDRLQRWSKVLRVVIRRLEYWIFGSVDSIRVNAIMSKMRDIPNPFYLSGWDSLELAFAIFRVSYGNDRFTRSHTTLNECFIRELPKIGISTVDGRLPRIALMNALLGIFSGLYHSLRTLQNADDLQNGQSLNLYDIDLVVYSDNIGSNGEAIGTVIIENIEGLPLKWSADIRKFHERRHATIKL
jgi:hypothetical protein